ncbi:hypothetical protein NL676_035397 [Syzygium grande]|nr:hypothetical protein NL676_035397 [Syzygium grande]
MTTCLCRPAFRRHHNPPSPSLPLFFLRQRLALFTSPTVGVRRRSSAVAPIGLPPPSQLSPQAAISPAAPATTWLPLLCPIAASFMPLPPSGFFIPSL